MRLLHTADWHIGRYLMNCSLEEDIRSAVEQVVSLARCEKPELIVHSGDVFDVLRPAYQDLQWGVDALRELAGIAPTVVLCGNHDSPALFTLLDRLLGPDSRLRFVSRALPPEMGGVLELPGPGDELIRLDHPGGPARLVALAERDDVRDVQITETAFLGVDPLSPAARVLFSAGPLDHRARADQLVAADVPGWDSLSNVTMISEVEKYFRIKVKLREILKMKNVGDLIDCIVRNVAVRAG